MVNFTLTNQKQLSILNKTPRSFLSRSATKPNLHTLESKDNSDAVPHGLQQLNGKVNWAVI